MRTKGKWKLHITPQWAKRRKFHIFPPDGGYAICSRDFQYQLDNDEPYEDFNEVIANAKYIVKAVNSHDKLVDLIQRAAPLAWATGHYSEDAHQWEIEAKTLLKELKQ